VEGAEGGVMTSATETPVYFVKQDLKGARHRLRKGELWPWQDKQAIRAWSESYGLPDDRRAFHLLPFVEVLVAPDLPVADAIVAKGMTIDETRKFLKEMAR
jgi:hypothetical protein